MTRAQKLATAPADIRTEWRRLNDAIDDIERQAQCSSSDPTLITLGRSDTGGLVLDCSGLRQLLVEKGIAIDSP